MENDLNTDSSARWYVVYTYSGYENKVKATLEKIVENKGIQEKIQEVIIPMEEEIEIKDGKQKSSIKKVFPGYVLVKMIMTDETWYVVKNIKGVFNFVGVGDKPLPLTEKDMQSLGIEDIINLDFEDETAKQEVLSLYDDLMAEMPDLEVGATLNDEEFLTKLNNFVKQSGMSVEQA